MEIEDRFEIDIPINLVSDITTVADLVALVNGSSTPRGGVMDILDKHALLAGRHEKLLRLGADLFAVRSTTCSATEADIAGRPTILAGTNNYLGLTYDPACIAAAEEALRRYGTGTTGSRIANGSYGCTRSSRPHSRGSWIAGPAWCSAPATGEPRDGRRARQPARRGADRRRLARQHLRRLPPRAQLVVRFRHNDPADLDRGSAASPQRATASWSSSRASTACSATAPCKFVE